MTLALFLYMYMLGPRIVQLPDGEELIFFEVDDRTSLLVEDPREELLEHRRVAEDVPERTATELSEMSGA